MKKYKLIKQYLGSGYKLGQTIETEHIWVNGKKYNLNLYPEFWEEVVEYPIGTKAYNKQNDNTYTRKEDGWYIENKTAYTDEKIKNSNIVHIINKKKVDKDYEIFTIGDKTNNGTISKFEIDTYGVRVFFEDIDINEKCIYYWYKNNIIHTCCFTGSETKEDIKEKKEKNLLIAEEKLNKIKQFKSNLK